MTPDPQARRDAMQRALRLLALFETSLYLDELKQVIGELDASERDAFRGQAVLLINALVITCWAFEVTAQAASGLGKAELLRHVSAVLVEET